MDEMKARRRLALVLALAFLFGGMSIPGCSNAEQTAQLQSLNADMTATKALLQQMTAALEIQNRRIAQLEARQAPAHPASAAPKAAAPAKKAAKAPSKRRR